MEEIFLPNPTMQVNGQQIWMSRFMDFDKVFDELDYTQGLRNAFVQAGLPSSIGVLIDTSRNGWGGPARPTSVSLAPDLNT